jgi:hypothetical protein
MFSNVILVAALLPGELAHVFILMPFMVPDMAQSLTTSPLTSPSSSYLPKLPTLLDQGTFTLFINNQLYEIK